MTDEETAYETRADYFDIDSDDPMFDMPEFVSDAQAALWYVENESE